MPSLDEYVTINGVVLALDDAWELQDPTPLLGEGPARGADRTIPGVDGVAYRPKKRGVWRDVLLLDVWGYADKDGTGYANYRNGMRDNLEYLRAQLLTANVGQVVVTYTFPDAATRSGLGEVLDLAVSSRSQTGNWTICGLELVLHDGILT